MKCIAARLVLALAFSVVGACSALAKSEFLAYEGRNAVHEGQGGNKKTVEGVDFWSNGDPPRRYKVVGAITDKRLETGLIGMIRMSGLEYDIAKAAKAARGDAVILEREGEDLLGVTGGASAFGSGNSNSFSGFASSFAAPVKAHQARYVVVAYLPDEALAPAVPPTELSAAGAQPVPSAPPPILPPQ